MPVVFNVDDGFAGPPTQPELNTIWNGSSHRVPAPQLLCCGAKDRPGATSLRSSGQLGRFAF